MNQDNKYWYLKNHRLFDQLSQKEVESLSIISNMKNARKNEAIHFSESESKKLFVIKIGIVKICREDELGKEIITEMLSEGDIFGHINPASNQYAKVISDEVKLCFFEISNFMSVLKDNPALVLKYNEAVSEKLISFQQKYEDLIFKDVDTRVVDFFKRYAKHHGTFVGNLVKMEMFLTHQDIANYTATSRQSVTTIIKKLVDKGKIIYEGRKKVIIPNILDL